MTDVLFTHSYFLHLDPKEHRAMMPYPPLGTLYAAAEARRQGYGVSLFDSMLAGSEYEIRTELDRHRPNVVVIYDDDFNYLTKMCLGRMREAAFTMSSLARAAGCCVIVHGSDAADHLEDYFAHGADYVLLGEGEQTLVEILDVLIRFRGDRAAIPGLAFLEDGGIHRTPPRPALRDLDRLTMPARDLVDMEQYRRLWVREHGSFSMNVVTTRGCPFHCNWCAKPIYGQVYNSRSPHNVAEEIETLKAVYRPDHLWFCDDIFGLTPGWVEAFSEEVVRRNAVIPFKSLGRVDLLLRGQTIEHLRKAGCKTVWVGAESGSQKILDAMEKGTTVKQIVEATRRLKQVGIQVGFFLQFGYPGETLEDIELTHRMIRECSPDDIGVSVSYPLPGTRFHDAVRRQLGQKHNWHDSQDLAMLFQGSFVPEFYRQLHRVTHKKFRIWQGMEALQGIVQAPAQTSPRRVRRAAAAAFHLATLPGHIARLNRLAHADTGSRRNHGSSH
jgi:anaerobic magnesium-protoporphyrin IX monomethyl ester cyclase